MREGTPGPRRQGRASVCSGGPGSHSRRRRSGGDGGGRWSACGHRQGSALPCRPRGPCRGSEQGRGRVCVWGPPASAPTSRGGGCRLPRHSEKLPDGAWATLPNPSQRRRRVRRFPRPSPASLPDSRSWVPRGPRRGREAQASLTRPLHLVHKPTRDTEGVSGTRPGVSAETPRRGAPHVTPRTARNPLPGRAPPRPLPCLLLGTAAPAPVASGPDYHSPPYPSSGTPRGLRFHPGQRQSQNATPIPRLLCQRPSPGAETKSDRRPARPRLPPLSVPGLRTHRRFPEHAERPPGLSPCTVRFPQAAPSPASPDSPPRPPKLVSRAGPGTVPMCPLTVLRRGRLPCHALLSSNATRLCHFIRGTLGQLTPFRGHKAFARVRPVMVPVSTQPRDSAQQGSAVLISSNLCA